MMIDEVANEVMNLWQALMELKGPEYEPKIAVYMGVRYFQECIGEIRGRVSYEAAEFIQSKTIHGFPVFRVHDNRLKTYQVVNLDSSIYSDAARLPSFYRGL